MRSLVVLISAVLVLLSSIFFSLTAEAKFLQTDPIGTQDQMNLYMYCGSDPLNCTDPTGEQRRGTSGSRGFSSPQVQTFYRLNNIQIQNAYQLRYNRPFYSASPSSGIITYRDLGAQRNTLSKIRSGFYDSYQPYNPGVSPSNVRGANTTLPALSLGSPNARGNSYPVNGGAMGPEIPTQLNTGQRISRFGSPEGRFTSPANTPMEQRSLPPNNTGQYRTYEVINGPITGVNSSLISPAYGQLGGGVQHRLPSSVRDLLSTSPPQLREVK